REKAKESDGTSESSSLQRQKVTGTAGIREFLASARESDGSLASSLEGSLGDQALI
ncbi:hypothetical protein A2U01_0079976, partial [Trifolium medium]|nr:hypothetical protein [Trifolium medium]